MNMTHTACDLPLSERALDVLRQAGNPFRNYFARNPDDEVCARFHVPELFERERAQLMGVVGLYRAAPAIHSEMIPVLGNKGAGKTHLLHSIKHGSDGAAGLLVTPGTFQKDTDFLEYLLFQVIDTLLSGGKQKCRRPLETISEELSRRLLLRALAAAGRDEQMDLFPVPALARWTRRLGLGSTQAQERTQWLTDQLSRLTPVANAPGSPAPGLGGTLRRLASDAGLDGDRTCELVWRHLDRMELHGTAGLMRRHIHHGFVRAALVGDESDLANFLTYGFAELDFKVQPTRQDLVLALFRVLLEVFGDLRIPIVIAFDQLEDLLLARRCEDGHRIAESFFAGIVQAMHQLDGLCFLVFAERGLWNRFVPSLDGYIQDRLNNPVHVPGHGTIKSLRLEAPPPESVRRVVEVRLRSALEGFAEQDELPALFPFSPEQVQQVARTEPTLRDMLQQYRLLFDHLVYGEVQKAAYETESGTPPAVPAAIPIAPLMSRALDLPDDVRVKSVAVVTTPAEGAGDGYTGPNLGETWEQEIKGAQERLLSEGAMTGATRELQLGLGAFLQTCFEHGVKLGPWRLQHVVPEWTFGEHPTYGVISIAHWVCRDGQPWKVGVGLFMARGAGKPRDLEIKLSALELTPAVIDHLILLRPEDDVALTGKTKAAWQESERRGRQTRLEPVSLASLAALYAFPRWLTVLGEALPPGQPLPNLAELIQERCDKLLEQVCMPVCP
jgi:hypothetical protein